MNLKSVYLIFTNFFIVTSYAQLNANEIYKTSSEYIVSIEVENKDKSISTGSGFYFEDIDAIVTNYHVIKNYEKIKIITFNGKQHNENFINANDSINDLALLRFTKGNNFKDGLKRNTEDYQIGQKIFVIGNPLGLNYTVTEGIISSIRQSLNNEIIQFTAPVSKGSSGSPILNENGQVLGVVSFQIREGQNLNFAIPIKYAVDLSNKYPLISTENKPTFNNEYDNVSSNNLMKLAEAKYDNANWNEKKRIIETILKRAEIKDSFYLPLTLKVIKDFFWVNLEEDFVKSSFNCFNDYKYNNGSLSTDELWSLLENSLAISKNYSYNDNTLLQLYLITAYALLKEKECQGAYVVFNSAFNINNTSMLALKGMSDFYRVYTKEVSKNTDSNFICKDKPLNFAEPDSVKYYLGRIIQSQPQFYNGYIKLLEFHFDKRSTKFYNPNLALDYFIKCNKLDSQNPLALKTYIGKFFLNLKGSKNLALYQKANELFSKYTQNIEKKSDMAKLFAENFKENSDSYNYSSAERKDLLSTSITYYLKEINYFFVEPKNDYYNLEKSNEYICGVYLKISQLYMDLNNYEMAYEYINKSLKLSPDYYKIYKMFGSYYLNKGTPNYKEAIYSFKKYIEIVPRPESSVLTDLATCYYYERDFETAEKYFVEAKSACSDCSWNNYLLALLYIDENKKENAIKLYKELIESKDYYLSDKLQKKLYPK